MSQTQKQWIQQAMEQFEGKLVRYAGGLVNDLDQARDLVQEAFLRLLKSDQSQVDPYLAPWLFRVVRNLALDTKRKEAHMQSLYNEAALDMQPSAEPTPETTLANQDMTAQIINRLKHLPPNQREVIRLKFQCDMSYREISEVTSLSVSNVGFLIHTGLKNLRQSLAPGVQSASGRGGVS